MGRTGKAIMGLLAIGLSLLLGLPVLMAAMVMGGSAYRQQDCLPPGDTALPAATHLGLSDSQLAVVATILEEGYRLGVPQRGLVVALAVASQESRFVVYANDGQGDDLRPEQRGIERSLELPHQAVGTDHGSLGVFQQQYPWWGSIEELMDPATSARKFFAALDQIEGWEQMSVGDAGQAVQRSAYPRAYDDDVELAEQLVAAGPGASMADPAVYFGGTTGGCAPVSYSAGDVVVPLPDSATYVDQKSFGNSGAHWASTHTGTDFSTACGTPVLASTAGLVTVRTDAAWSGRWLVEVDSGAGGVVTWYAHMQAVHVATGDQVSAGDVIGAVGSEGNSTGCHLHFEVRPGGGDPVDPTAWLAANVGRGSLPGGADSQTASVVVMTSNVAFWMSQRAARDHILGLLDEGPDVLVLQEVTNRDVHEMVTSARGSWAAWQPAGAKGGSAIVWNASKFRAAKRGVELGFRGHEYDRWMPWVLLDSEAGTLPVVGLHLPARARSDRQMRSYYRTMTRNYTELVGDLSQAGYPPIVGGDWNHHLDEERASWSPVPVLRSLGMTTNWQVGRPCPESVPNGRIDGFAFNASYLQVLHQGCLPMGRSDHRPVWVAVAPAG